jgi:catechol 2,3-dioxygenase-like lactoylglutathione lyase family enzyme
MPLELQGLRTIIYPAPDLDAARAWWTRALGHDPYFDQPFYVGYDVAGYELGLLPEGNPSDGALTYWGVPDVPAAVAEALRVGATEHNPATEVGDGIITATVRTSTGSVVGFIDNPHFAAR